MKIHSDKLTFHDVLEAGMAARVKHGQDFGIDECGFFHSRKRARGYEVYACSLEGKRASAHGHGRRAASWTAYGYFIAELFNRDSEAIVGMYADVDAFVDWCTEDGMHRAVPRGESNAFLDILEA